MDNADVHQLIAKVEQLIRYVDQLKAENRSLRSLESSWRDERAQLIEKNDIAREKIESTIMRLRTLEQRI